MDFLWSEMGVTLSVGGKYLVQGLNVWADWDARQHGQHKSKNRF